MIRILAWTYLAFAPSVHAGTLVNNGGDSIFCQALGSKYPADGFYVLDYALSFPSDSAQTHRPVSLNESLARIEQLLVDKAPEGLVSFRSFRASLTPNPFTNTLERVWRPVRGELRDIRDEVARQMPKNCRWRSGSNKYYGFYVQTVIRSNRGSRVLYVYDPDLVDDYLSRPDPLQASILMVHEWLWDFYQGDRLGAARIRAANAYLHSPAAESDLPEVFQRRVFRASAEKLDRPGKLR